MTKEDQAKIMAIFAPLGEELALDIIKHRKGLKCPLTPRGATALMKQYQMAGNAVAAAEHHLNMGWRGFEVAWLKGKGFSDPHNPMATSDIDLQRLRHDLRWAREEGDRAKEARIKALIEQATSGVRAH